jgi:hypothetical protein
MGPSEAIETFDRMTWRGPRWFFRIVDAGNHEILAASEAYNSAWSRDKTAKRLAKKMGCPIGTGKRR